MKVVIIEDEKLCATELSRMLNENFKDIEVLALLDSVDSATEWFKSGSCDMVFMDIHLSDGLCFSIFERVEIDAPVIFTTAYDNYAITAFEHCAVGYLLKPIDQEKLVSTVTHQRAKMQRRDLSELLSKFNSSTGHYKERLRVKTRTGYDFIVLKSVEYFYAEERVTFAKITAEKRQIVDQSLDELEEVLNPREFYRVSRSMITSISAITSIEKYFGGRLSLTLSDGQKMVVSAARVAGFLTWIDS